jgi:hypothetical protein
MHARDRLLLERPAPEAKSDIMAPSLRCELIVVDDLSKHGARSLRAAERGGGEEVKGRATAELDQDALAESFPDVQEEWGDHRATRERNDRDKAQTIPPDQFGTDYQKAGMDVVAVDVRCRDFGSSRERLEAPS